MRVSLQRSVWWARLLMHAIGWPGMAGLSVAALSVVFHFQVMAPLHSRVEEIKHHAEKLRRKATVLRPETTATDPARQLAEFYALFPDGDAMADSLERLYAAAALENLVLEQGEYHLAPETSGRLLRYDIVLPVKGSYPALRHFISHALRENPTLALEGVSFGRPAVMTIGVDAQIRMALYLGRAL